MTGMRVEVVDNRDNMVAADWDKTENPPILSAGDGTCCTCRDGAKSLGRGRRGTPLTVQNLEKLEVSGKEECIVGMDACKLWYWHRALHPTKHHPAV